MFDLVWTDASSKRFPKLSLNQSSKVGDLRTLAQKSFGQWFLRRVASHGLALQAGAATATNRPSNTVPPPAGAFSGALLRDDTGGPR